MSVFVHGGAGALGQAVISIALAHGCDIYTTVSDIRKKKCLLKLFPKLKGVYCSSQSTCINFGNTFLHLFVLF